MFQISILADKIAKITDKWMSNCKISVTDNERGGRTVPEAMEAPTGGAAWMRLLRGWLGTAFYTEEQHEVSSLAPDQIVF